MTAPAPPGGWARALRARRRQAWLLLALCLAMPAQAALPAQTESACPPAEAAPSTAQIQAAAATAVDRGFLWRLDKAGSTSYLYGTVHLGKLQWASPGPRVRAALEATQALALELDIADPATLHELRAGMAARPDEPPLPAEVQAGLADEVAAACLPATALDGQQPLMRAFTLAVLAARWDGLSAGYAQEAVLSGYAHARGKPIIALETVQAQLAALLPPSAELRLQRIKRALAQLRSGAARRGAARLIQTWADGDWEGLRNYEAWCECVLADEDREMLRRLNDERNPAIADAIDRLHRQGRTLFAAVGALHMTGPQALPELLARRGFSVELVSFRK